MEILIRRGSRQNKERKPPAVFRTYFPQQPPERALGVFFIKDRLSEGFSYVKYWERREGPSRANVNEDEGPKREDAKKPPGKGPGGDSLVDFTRRGRTSCIAHYLLAKSIPRCRSTQWIHEEPSQRFQAPPLEESQGAEPGRPIAHSQRASDPSRH